MKFSMKDIFSKWDQIFRLLRIWSHLLKISFMEKFIFCDVTAIKFLKYVNVKPYQILCKLLWSSFKNFVLFQNGCIGFQISQFRSKFSQSDLQSKYSFYLFAFCLCFFWLALGSSGSFKDNDFTVSPFAR